MRTTWLVMTLALAGAACGEVKHANGDGGTDAPPDPNDGMVSGTRLKLQWLDFGGAKSPSGIFDTQLATPCYFTKMTDGVQRCVPNTAAGLAYSNAGCTQKMALVYHPAMCTVPPTPAYVRESEDSPCASTVAHVYRTGTQLATTQFWQKSSDGSCQGPYMQTQYDYFAIGAEVPLTELATGTLTAAPSTGRLVGSFLESPDGLRIPNMVHDTQLDVDCYLQQTPGDGAAGRCFPTDVTYGGYYKDDVCSEHVAERQSTCPMPTVAVSSGQCPGDPQTFFKVAGALTPPPASIYYQSDTCVGIGVNSTSTYYDLSPPIELAASTRERGTSGGRLDVIRLKTPDGFTMRDYPLYDNQLGAECYPQQDQDGHVTCVPFGGNGQALYADAACTTDAPVALVYRGRDTCAPPARPKYAVRYTNPTECTSAIETRLLGTPHTGAVYTKQSDGSCTLLDTSNQSVYDVGPAIMQDQLATGTLVTDP